MRITENRLRRVIREEIKSSLRLCEELRFQVGDPLVDPSDYEEIRSGNDRVGKDILAFWEATLSYLGVSDPFDTAFCNIEYISDAEILGSIDDAEEVIDELVSVVEDAMSRGNKVYDSPFGNHGYAAEYLGMRAVASAIDRVYVLTVRASDLRDIAPELVYA